MGSRDSVGAVHAAPHCDRRAALKCLNLLEPSENPNAQWSALVRTMVHACMLQSALSLGLVT